MEITRFRLPPHADSARLSRPEMPDSQHLIRGLAAATGVVFAYKLWRQHTSLKLLLPPHPKSYPLIGNLLAIPQSNEHLAFIQLGEQLHSDIISLSALGTVIVVVNNVQGATDLLEKRSSIYSDRPSLPMVTEPSLLNWGGYFAVIGYNDRLKTYRRLIHPWLQKSAVEKSHAELQHQARLLLQRMLQLSGQQTWSEDLEKEFYRMFSMTLAHSIYGYQMKGPDDTFTASLREAIGNISKAGLASNFLVNLFPSLKHVPEWFPGASWKRVAQEWRQQQETAVDSSYNWAKRKIASGSDDGSIIRSLLENTRDIDDIDGYTKQIAVALFAGGTDTTTSTLVSFILAMVLFPETQAKAQREIDTVVGNNRLPAMDDRPRLPYVERLITEVQRWCPAVPIGIPHACRQDDIYQGYLIPKGTIVIGNIWAMSRDSTIYKDPEIFNPDRFEDASVPPAPTFGFGRRICPGISYAESSLFISITSILATFTIGMAKDENGNDIVPVMEAENSIIYHQKPFRLTLNPRSDQHERMIRTGEL